MTAEQNPTRDSRPRGRPRLDIDLDAVADAVAELFAEGGLDAVTILDAAEKLSVSRATLYRTVPTKEDLLGILFERSTAELTKSATAALAEVQDTGDRLVTLVELQVEAAIRMRRYMPVFFGGGGIPSDVFERWHSWSRDYENIWIDVVKANIAEGLLPDGDPVITTRLLLGSTIWVSRWYRPSDDYDAAVIAQTAMNLIRAAQGKAPQGGEENSAGRARKVSSRLPRLSSRPKAKEGADESA